MPRGDRPIRVLHVLRHLGVGGVKTVVVGLLRNLDAGIVHNTVCSVMSGGPVEDAMRQTGARVVIPGIPIWRLPAAPFALAKLIREHSIDIVHAHLPWLEIVSIMAARMAGGVKVVCHEHSRIGSTVIPPWLQAPFTRRADYVIGVSDSVARDVRVLLGVPDGQVVTVHNATDLGAIDSAPRVDLRAELDIPADVPLIGFAGRLVRQKGVQVLIEAAVAIREAHPQAHIAVIGDGPYGPNLREQVDRLRIADVVHFLGARTDVFGILKDLSLYVHPSFNEGLPMVVLEAMGAGVAVVATAVDGTPEVVVDGETGYLVPPKDAAALAAAINTALSDPARLLSMGRAGRRRIEEQFTFAGAARKVERVYRELMDEL